MNDKQIETFLCVVETQSYTETARKLYLSQPAVTYRIQSLEKELRVKLFISENTSVALTEAGRSFVPHAQCLRQQFMQADDALAPFRRDTSKVLLGVPAMMLQWRCKAFLSITQAFHNVKDIRFTYKVFDSAEECFRNLNDDVIDITLTDLGLRTMNSSFYSKKPLFEGNVYVCISKTHLLAQKSEMLLYDLEGETVIWFRDSTFMQSMLREEMMRQGVHVTDIECGSLAEAVTALQPDHCVTFSNNIPFQDDNLCFIRLQMHRSMPIGLIWKTKSTTKEVRKAVQIISELPRSIWRM